MNGWASSLFFFSTRSVRTWLLVKIAECFHWTEIKVSRSNRDFSTYFLLCTVTRLLAVAMLLALPVILQGNVRRGESLKLWSLNSFCVKAMESYLQFSQHYLLLC